MSWKKITPDMTEEQRQKALAQNARNRASQIRSEKKNPEHYAAYKLAWARKNSDKVRASEKAFDEANPGKRRANSAAYRERHRERYTARLAKYRADNRERLLEYGRAYYWKNREENLAKSRAYRRAHAAELSAKKKKWIADNRAIKAARDLAWQRSPNGKRAKANTHVKRKAWKKGAEITATSADLNKLRKAQKSCYYCGVRGRLEIDHVVALSKGGRHSPDNLVMACKFCNRSKGNRDPQQFARSKGLLFA